MFSGGSLHKHSDARLDRLHPEAQQTKRGGREGRRSRITHQVLCGQPASDVRRTASGAAPPAPPARCRYSPAAQPSASPSPLRLGRTVALRAHAALASRGYVI